MVFRVMVVDDERLDLEWLKQGMPWDELNLNVSAVNNAFKALELLQDEPCDLLISDIRMPIMSGLELAEKAKARWPGLKIIFISGHDDFEYAKQAIRMNAYGYVLKPVDQSELTELLKRVIYEMEQERQWVLERKELQETLPLVKNELLLQWLEERGARPLHEDDLEDCGLNPTRPLRAAVLEIDGLRWTLQRAGKLKEDELKRVSSVITQTIREQQMGHVFQATAHRFVLLSHQVPTDFSNRLNILLDRVRKHTGQTITIGLGKDAHVIDELKSSYQEAVQALEHKMFLGKGRILRLVELSRQSASEPLKLDEELEALMRAMDAYDLVGIDDRLQQCFRYIDRLSSDITVYHFIIHLISKIDVLLRKNDEAWVDLLGWPPDQPESLYRLETSAEIQSWLRRCLFECSEKMLIRKESRNRKMIDEIKAFVNGRLQDKVTLKEVADHFGFSPNYLGHVFKEETGVNFSDFLLKERLETAGRLLLDPTRKVYEIADRIGYKNIIYFNRQFKDYYGQTPSQYRKANKV